MRLVLVFLSSFILSIAATWVVKKIALRFNIVDQPSAAPDRKVHGAPTPLLGGLAIYVTFFAVVATLSLMPGVVTGTHILPKYLWGIFFAATIVMIGGYVDDRYHLSPGKQILFPLLATITIIASGIGVRLITNPLGGVIHLDNVTIPILSWKGIGFHITLWADLFTFVWLMGMMYTTKLLDGLDGLVAGITAIGSIAVFILSMRPPVLQPETAQLALILAGACCGFLIFNWHPAQIFFGEGGALLTGFLLGTLAIIAGSKIATALLIMGIPILDVIWVIVRRTFLERRSHLWTPDRKHLHFRLLDVGFSHRGAVLFLYGLTIVFSATALFLRGFQKLVALIVLAAVMVTLGIILVTMVRKRDLVSRRGT